MDSEKLNEYQIREQESVNSLIDIKQKNQGSSKFKFSLLIVLRIFVMIVAAVLCWTCNTNTNEYMRILYTVLAVVFAEFYVLYYTFYHVFMGIKC